MASIRPDEFASAINEILKDFKDVTEEQMQEAVDSVARESADRLKTSDKTPRLTGKYAKSWSAKLDKRSKTLYKKVVYNSKHYRLTHLLERGHKVKGGQTKAYEHIAPVEEWASNEILERIKRGIGK